LTSDLTAGVEIGGMAPVAATQVSISPLSAQSTQSQDSMRFARSAN
jgi:hypothetical protein